MSGKKMLDMSSLMRSAGSTTPATLPGVHGRRQEPEVPEPVTPESASEEHTRGADPDPAQPARQEDVSDPEPVSERPAKKETSQKRKSTPAKTKRAPATPKRAAKTATKKEAPDSGGGEGDRSEPEELVSLDGRPARLWDISDGKALPPGWAKIAVARVHAATRKFRADRRNATLPDNIYAACNDYIYDEARTGGLDLTLSNLAEAAFEQIPQDDEASIQRLLDTLPDAYYGKGMPTRPRTFQLFDPTLQQMQNLARMLRALGFTSMTGLVQTAALRELLLDLGREVD